VRRALIVNADDLGLSEAVDRGILAAHLDGIVTSTSLLAGGPTAASAIALVRAEAPRLGIGLHVDLTEGRPLEVIRAMSEAHSDEVGETALKMIERQLKLFVQLVGEYPDHLDAHQHLVHFHPAAFEAYLSIARQYDLPVRSPAPFLDMASFRAFIARVRRDNGVDLGPVLPPGRALIFALEQKWRAARVSAPDRFAHEFYGATATVESLVERIRKLPEGTTELMCHPGLADEGVEGYDSGRAKELAVLTDPRVRAAADQAGVALQSYAGWRGRALR
jgi:predicted glycoside hydrolase/deacetylase ChbG (UPF0249 family)